MNALWQSILAVFENVLLNYQVVRAESAQVVHGVKYTTWYVTRRDGSR